MEGETRTVHFTDPVTRAFGFEFLKNDVKTLPKWQADICIDSGWGRDEKTGHQGERIEGAGRLVVEPLQQQVGVEGLQ